jgi:predicted membrane metal-binding protein
MNRVLYDMFVHPVATLATGFMWTIAGLIVGLIAGGGFGVAAFFAVQAVLPAMPIEFKVVAAFYATLAPGSIAAERVFRRKRLMYVTVRGRPQGLEMKEGK